MDGGVGLMKSKLNKNFTVRLIFYLLLVFPLLFFLTACDGDEKKEAIRDEIFNNGGNFVKYGNFIFFREYNALNFEESGLWNSFAIRPGSWSEIKKMSVKTNKINPLFKDQGFGNIYIFEGREKQPVYLLNEINVESAGKEIYGVFSEGQEIETYSQGSIFALDMEREKIIVNHENGAISAHSLDNSFIQIMKEAYHRPLHYDQKEGILYCEDASGGSPDQGITITSCNLSGRSEKILTLSGEEINFLTDNDYSGDYYQVKRIEKKDKDIFITLAGYGGNAGHFYSWLVLEVDANDLTYQVLENPDETYWYQEGKPFTYKEDGPFYADDPRYFVLNSEDEGEKIEVLSYEDLALLDFKEGDVFYQDYFRAIDYIEYVDGQVFFSISNGNRHEAEDVGWRWGYRRGESMVYKKDLANGEIDLLYSY